MDKKEQKKPVVLAWIVLAVILFCGIVLGIFFLVNYFNYINTDKASIEGNKVSLSSKMMGRVKNAYVAEGDRVKKGDLLLDLDDTDLQAQKIQAEASVNLSEQNLSLAGVNLDKAQRDFDRIKKLNSAGATTSEQYEHAMDGLKAAQFQYSISEAQLSISKAQINSINVQIGNTRIISPVDGVVSKKNIMPGEIVQPGMALIVVTDPDNLWITANFEETKIRYIQKRQKVDINVDAYPKYDFKGHVDMILPAIVAPPLSIGETTKTTQKIPVKILIDNIPGDMVLLPGMSVEVKIKIN